MASGLLCCIDYFSHFRGHFYLDGWAFHPDHTVTGVDVELPARHLTRAAAYGRPSPDVAAQQGKGAINCRFALDVEMHDANETRGVRLIVHLKGAADVAIDVQGRVEEQLLSDPYHLLFDRFFHARLFV